MSYYSQNPHYLPDDTSMFDERQERIEAEAGRWFADMTKPQKARFDERMLQAAAYRGTDLWDRARAAAQLQWELDTVEARIILGQIMQDLEKTGEISEHISTLADSVIARNQVLA